MEKLYYTKPDEFTFDVIVTRKTDTEIKMAPFPFYPGGGGQPPDSGLVVIEGVSYSVMEIDNRGIEPLARLDPGLVESFTEKKAIAIVDNERRHILSRLHTSLHIVNAVVHQKFGAKVTGVQMHSDGTARIDFNLPNIKNSEIWELEPEINKIVTADLPISVRELPLKKALKIPGVVRTENKELKLNKEEMVRIVEIQGVDKQGCGGTHVKSTRECGKIKFKKVDNKGRGNRRIKIELTD